MSNPEPEQAPPPTAGSALYFNGFGTGIGAIDLSVFLMLNQSPQLELKMTYSTAKGLAKALQDAVATYEKHSGAPVISGIELSNTMTANMRATKGK